MERQSMRLAPVPVLRRGRLSLVTADGDPVPRPQIAPIDSPELPMTIRFEGISPSQQRAALAGFPGGRRFVLQG